MPDTEQPVTEGQESVLTAGTPAPETKPATQATPANNVSVLSGHGHQADGADFIRETLTVLSLGAKIERTAKTGAVIVRRSLRFKGILGTFYAFADSITNIPEFIPEAGITAVILSKKKDYTDAEGNEIVDKPSICSVEFQLNNGMNSVQLGQLGANNVALFTRKSE